METLPPVPSQDAQPRAGLGAKILQNSFWLLAQQVADLLLAFVFTWIALRRIGPESFGVLTLTQALLNLSGLATLNFELALIRIVPDFRSQGLWRTARQTVWLTAVIKILLAALVSLALFVAAPGIAALYHQPGFTTALRVGCLSLFAAALAEVGAAACLSLLHPEVRALMTTVRRTIEVIGLLVITSFQTDVAGVVLALAAADTVAAAGYAIFTLRFLRQNPTSVEVVNNPALLRRMWNYSMPLFGARLSDVGGRELSKLILGQLASAATVGYYGVARLAIERLMTLASQAPLGAVPVLAGLRKTGQAAPSFSRGMSPSLPIRSQRPFADATETGAMETGATLELFKYQLIAGALAVLGIWAISPPFVRILGGPEYTPAVLAMRILGFSVLFWAGTASLHALFLVREHTSGIFYLNTVQILVTAAALAMWVRPWGVNGAALADSAGMLASLLFGLFLMARWFRFPSRLGLKLLAQVLLPVLLLLLPAALLIGRLIPDSLWIQAAWLLVTLALYGSYGIATNLLPIELWKRAAAVNLPFPPLNRMLHAAIRLVEGYHGWLRRFGS